MIFDVILYLVGDLVDDLIGDLVGDLGDIVGITSLLTLTPGALGSYHPQSGTTHRVSLFHSTGTATNLIVKVHN